MKRQTVIHINKGNGAGAPSASDINYGEIAVNYSTDNESLYIKNSSGNVVSFITSDEVESKIQNKLTITGVTGVAPINVATSNKISTITHNQGSVVTPTASTSTTGISLTLPSSDKYGHIISGANISVNLTGVKVNNSLNADSASTLVGNITPDKITDLSSTVKGIKVNNAFTADTANSVSWANVANKPSFSSSGITTLSNAVGLNISFVYSNDGTLKIVDKTSTATTLATVNLPKETFLSAGSYIAKATADDVALDSNVIIGDPYIKLTILTSSTSNIYSYVYIPVKELVDVYKGSGVISVNSATNVITHNTAITSGQTISASQSPAHGGNFNIPSIKYDTYGHITGVTTATVTLPAASINTDSATTESGHYAPSGSAITAGTSSTFIKQVVLDSKRHITGVVESSLPVDPNYYITGASVAQSSTGITINGSGNNSVAKFTASIVGATFASASSSATTSGMAGLITSETVINCGTY